jgi:peptidoglycan/xylan/chitin deacetylase (PgdA/CDA1 family)
MRLPILMFHMFGPAQSREERRYCCSEPGFARQMAFLASRGYVGASIDTAYEYLSGRRTSPERVVAITMDDGTKDNYEVAVPVLRRFGFTATVFVVTEHVGKISDWSVEDGLPPRKLMGWEELRGLAETGFEIGSHSRSHVDLSRLSDSQLTREVEDSKKEIEYRIGRPVLSFAYPYGFFDARVKEAVAEAGYQAACTTDSGFNGREEDPHALRRLEIRGTDSLRQFRRKLTFGVSEAPIALSVRYYMGRAGNRLSGYAGLVRT